MPPPAAAGRGLIQQKIQQLQPRSTSPQKRRRRLSGETETGMEVVKDMIERQMAEFAKLRDEFQQIANSMRTELGSLKVRITDLEEHTNRKDEELEKMGRRLEASEKACDELWEQVHANEVINRLPTLIFSGPAVVNSAPPKPRPGAGSPQAGTPAGQGRSPAAGADPRSPAGGGEGSAGSADRTEQERAGEELADSQPRPADSYVGAVAAGLPAGPAGAGQERGPAADQRPTREQEDVEATLIALLNSVFPDLNVRPGDIDRAHRTRGKIWCRFVKSGSGSVRDRLYNGRLGLRNIKGGDKLYISESLTRYRQEIFTECLALKKQGKIYTVFTRYGSVYVKEKRHGYSVRVDDWGALRGLKL